MRRPHHRSHPAAGADSGPARADGYTLLTTRLTALRVATDRDGRGDRAIGTVRDDHAELVRLLGDAVSQAFAADAVNAPRPAGVTSWVAEGLARSQEREIALLAATDISGLAQVKTAPGLHWGGSGE
jgi:hypothetical protein